MDLIYTDTNRVEQGVLQNFDVDFDCTNTRDFQITVGINNNVMQGGSWWYIEGTEYGGKVDAYKVLSESGEIRYNGRNFRGILTKKIIEPPAGEDYRIVSGNLQDVVGGLIANAHLQDIFIVDNSSITVSNHKINRYVSLYDGICTIAKKYGLVPAFKVKYGKVHISFYYPTDYTSENEYTQDDLKFSITKTFSNVNHLICLGQGELKDRTVIHLYADKDGNVSEKQTLFGIDEVVDIYENTNAENVDELKTEGIQRMNDLKNTDSFDVTAPDITLKIGDIIGGMERVTNTYVAREIVNIIARISDNKVDIEYKVGEDDTASKSSSGGSSSSGGDGGITLRPASKTELGGIIVGDGLNVNEDGKLSAQKQTDNNYSDEEKKKLSGIANDANKTIVDSVLSENSENPVQNKIITARLNEVFQSVSNGKAEIAAAITDKGVITAADSTFLQMANNIGLIGGGGIVYCERIGFSNTTNYGEFDTNISPTENTWYEIGIKPLGITGEYLFGLVNFLNHDGSNASYRLLNYNGTLYWDYGHDTYWRVSGNTLYAGEYADLILKNGEVWKNGTKILQGNVNPSISTTLTLKVSGQFVSVELSYLKIHESDELIADFVPIISNGILAFYNKVKGEILKISGDVYCYLQ